MVHVECICGVKNVDGFEVSARPHKISMFYERIVNAASSTRSCIKGRKACRLVPIFDGSQLGLIGSARNKELTFVGKSAKAVKCFL